MMEMIAYEVIDVNGLHWVVEPNIRSTPVSIRDYVLPAITPQLYGKQEPEWKLVTAHIVAYREYKS
jgi:hypothetical protein